MHQSPLPDSEAARRNELRRFLDLNDAARYAELRGAPAIDLTPAETAEYELEIQARSDELIKLYAIELLDHALIHRLAKPAGRSDDRVLPGCVSWLGALDLVGAAMCAGWDGLESFTRSKDIRDSRKAVERACSYEAKRQRVRKEAGPDGLAILDRALCDGNHPARELADWHYPETDGGPRIDPMAGLLDAAGGLPPERAAVRKLFEMSDLHIDEWVERMEEAHAAMPRIMQAELAALERYEQAVGHLFNLLAGGEVSALLYDDKSGEAPRIDVRYWRAAPNRSLNHEGAVTVPADRLEDWSGAALSGCVLLERASLESLAVVPQPAIVTPPDAGQVSQKRGYRRAKPLYYADLRRKLAFFKSSGSGLYYGPMSRLMEALRNCWAREGLRGELPEDVTLRERINEFKLEIDAED